jgi:hypothetical protein
MKTNSIILTNQQAMSYVGEAARGDGFYGFSDGLHTVSFHVKNFTGRIFIEATLIEEPTDDDWFNINLMVDQVFLQWDNETETLGVSFVGNFVHLRASVDRSYLVNQTYDPVLHGTVDKVVLMI